MTTHIIIDCRNINNEGDFYSVFADQIPLNTHFGANLDALWDVLTTDLSLPILIRLNNFNSFLHSNSLKPIINLIDEARIELNGEIELQLNAPKLR